MHLFMLCTKNQSRDFMCIIHLILTKSCWGGQYYPLLQKNKVMLRKVDNLFQVT